MDCIPRVTMPWLCLTWPISHPSSCPDPNPYPGDHLVLADHRLLLAVAFEGIGEHLAQLLRTPRIGFSGESVDSPPQPADLQVEQLFAFAACPEDAVAARAVDSPTLQLTLTGSRRSAGMTGAAGPADLKAR